MQIFEYGSPEAPFVLVQPVDGHDLSGMEREVSALREAAGPCFRLLAVRVGDWFRDLSPWSAPPVFGAQAFGDGARDTLDRLLALPREPGKRYVIGGYSLAGLFALWAGTRTDAFEGVAAASPSVWFPGFTEYLASADIRAKFVSLSLGDREEKTRNPVMASVGDRIRETLRLLEARGVPCRLDWNEGNHFRDPDLRTARAFARVLGELSGLQAPPAG